MSKVSASPIANALLTFSVWPDDILDKAARDVSQFGAEAVVCHALDE